LGDTKPQQTVALGPRGGHMWVWLNNLENKVLSF
jgi:hypothetical protein